jgi:hypothetical protein
MKLVGSKFGALTLLACGAVLLGSTNGWASEVQKKSAEATTEPQATAQPNSSDELRGVSLGEFRIRSYYPVDAQKSTVRFTLFAAVKDENFAGAQRLVEEHRQMLRDQILTATRLAPLATFQEPDLRTFRRRVLLRIRRALPELEVVDLYVSDFDLLIKSL